MLKHYVLGIVLQCFYSVLFSQPCTLTQADLLAAPGPGFTIPAGAVLCINSNFCMGAASNFSKGLQVVSMQRSGGELRREKILIK